MTQGDNPLNENNFVATKCSNCGAPLAVDQDQGKAVCEYCGVTYIINKGSNNSDDRSQNNDDQNVKKGFAQSAFEFLDRQQEREFQKLMDERRRQEEAAKLKLIQDEVKRERRIKIWKTIGGILLWIYLLPIMLTVYIWKNEKIQPKIRYLLIVGMWAFMVFCFVYGESHQRDDYHRSSFVVNENTSTNRKKAVEEVEETKDTNVKERAEDFEKGQIKYEFGDFEIRIPSSWERKEMYFYPETGADDKFTVFYVLLSEDISLTAEEFASPEAEQDFLVAMLSQYQNGRIISSGKEDINGIHVIRSEIEGTLSNKNGTALYYWFINPSDGKAVIIMFFQGNDTEYDHFADVEKVIESLYQVK